jgi:phospholipid/cholesterol/gamma-HCH transport system permease protein
MNPLTLFRDLYITIITFVSDIGAGVMMLWDALLGIPTNNPRAFKRITAQMALVGLESLPIVLITLLFGGMVMGLHTANQAVRYGASQFIGGAVAVSVAREVAPTLTGIVVAARIGSAFAAELGSMKITNQIDALRAMATNPVRYLVTPRLIAAFIMLPILTMYANVMGLLGGGLVSISAGVAYQTFINSASTYLRLSDVGGGLLKTAVFGIIIAITSCYVGLNTEHGATGVGRSTTSAVVWSIVLLYAANFVLAWLLWSSNG